MSNRCTSRKRSSRTIIRTRADGLSCPRRSFSHRNVDTRSVETSRFLPCHSDIRPLSAMMPRSLIIIRVARERGARNAVYTHLVSAIYVRTKDSREGKRERKRAEEEDERSRRRRRRSGGRRRGRRKEKRTKDEGPRRVRVGGRGQGGLPGYRWQERQQQQQQQRQQQQQQREEAEEARGRG